MAQTGQATGAEGCSRSSVTASLIQVASLSQENRGERDCLVYKYLLGQIESEQPQSRDDKAVYEGLLGH